MTKKADVWVSHEFIEKNILDGVMICESLLKLNSLKPFLTWVVTGDEKWIIHNNIRRKRSWWCGPSKTLQSVAKADLYPKKVMLSVWWDWRGVLYFELLPYDQTIDAKKYCAQLENLKRAVAEKRPELANRKGVIFHHDNAKTTHCFGDQAEIKELWLGSYTASIVLPRHCAVGLLPVSIAPKQSRRTALWFNERYPEIPGGLFRAEVTWLLQKWNYVPSRTLAEDRWSRWTICSGLNKSLGTIHFCFNVGQKNRRT